MITGQKQLVLLMAVAIVAAQASPLVAKTTRKGQKQNSRASSGGRVSSPTRSTRAYQKAPSWSKARGTTKNTSQHRPSYSRSPRKATSRANYPPRGSRQSKVAWESHRQFKNKQGVVSTSRFHNKMRKTPASSRITGKWGKAPSTGKGQVTRPAVNNLMRISGAPPSKGSSLKAGRGNLERTNDKRRVSTIGGWNKSLAGNLQIAGPAKIGNNANGPIGHIERVTQEKPNVVLLNDFGRNVWDRNPIPTLPGPANPGNSPRDNGGPRFVPVDPVDIGNAGDPGQNPNQPGDAPPQGPGNPADPGDPGNNPGPGNPAPPADPAPPVDPNPVDPGCENPPWWNSPWFWGIIDLIDNEGGYCGGGGAICPPAPCPMPAPIPGNATQASYYLGFSGTQIPQVGFNVQKVEAQSPADAAGIKPGDIILGVGGERMTGAELLNAYLYEQRGVLELVIVTPGTDAPRQVRLIAEVLESTTF